MRWDALPFPCEMPPKALTLIPRITSSPRKYKQDAFVYSVGSSSRHHDVTRFHGLPMSESGNRLVRRGGNRSAKHPRDRIASRAIAHCTMKSA